MSRLYGYRGPPITRLTIIVKGVESVEVNRKLQKVTVIGYVDRNKVLKKVKGTGKRTQFWPYVPCNLVYYPYTPEIYDKKAPPGHVRNADYRYLSNSNRPLKRR